MTVGLALRANPLAPFFSAQEHSTPAHRACQPRPVATFRPYAWASDLVRSLQEDLRTRESTRTPVNTFPSCHRQASSWEVSE
jgi:hypothetical protein